MAINLRNTSGVSSQGFAHLNPSGGQSLPFNLSATPTPGNALIVAASFQSAVGGSNDFVALTISSIVDSLGNSFTPLSQENINFTSGTTFQNGSQIWYLTPCSNPTSLTVTVAGGSSNPSIEFGDLAQLFIIVYEVSPVLFDVAAGVTVASGTHFSGPTLLGTGTDFYVLSFTGGAESGATFTVTGWTPQAAFDVSGTIDVSASLISSGSQATAFVTHSNPAPYAIAGAAFLERATPNVSPSSLSFVNRVWNPNLPSVGSGTLGFGTQNPQTLQISVTGDWTATSQTGLTLIQPSSGSGDTNVQVGINAAFDFPRGIYANRIISGQYSDNLVISAGGSTSVPVVYSVGWGDRIREERFTGSY